MPYHCGLCDDSFNSKADLKRHIAHHPDILPPVMYCPVCKWPFDDQLALEAHQRSSEHPSPLSDIGTAVAITCDRCSNDFTSQKEYMIHRSWPSGTCADFINNKTTPTKPSPPPVYVEHDKPTLQPVQDAALGREDVATLASEAANMSDDGTKCDICHKSFRSLGKFNNHFLACQSASGSITTSLAITTESSETIATAMSCPLYQTQEVQNGIIKTKPMVQHRMPVIHIGSEAVSQARNSMFRPGTATQSEKPFSCQKRGCAKSFKSELALKAHDGDVHGIASQNLDLHSRDSWTLGNREREQDRLRAEALLRVSPGTIRGRGSRRPLHARRCVATGPGVATTALAQVHQVHVHPRPPPPGPAMPICTNAGGPAEMEQAKLIQGKILRLLIQSDIYITNYGKLRACGIDWIRVRMYVQSEVVGTIESMVHLPKSLQDEYAPFPKAFSEEYQYAYHSEDFQKSPARDSMKPGLGAVALACSKVILADGAQEVVKVAAVDVVSGRILMNHLVCTSPNAAVADWHSASTGLFAWRDMERARSYGYKVFRGWSAVRSALHQFIDKDTILVGHRLRSDLDALRMIHGQAIDVAKVYEKAANGPLNKMQLGLDSMCKQLFDTELKDDPEYGRDVLMNAFAARDIVLWASKNEETLRKKARQTSLDLQRAGLSG